MNFSLFPINILLRSGGIVFCVPPLAGINTRSLGKRTLGSLLEAHAISLPAETAQCGLPLIFE